MHVSAHSISPIRMLFPRKVAQRRRERQRRSLPLAAALLGERRRRAGEVGKLRIGRGNFGSRGNTTSAPPDMERETIRRLDGRGVDLAGGTEGTIRFAVRVVAPFVPRLNVRRRTDPTARFRQWGDSNDRLHEQHGKRYEQPEPLTGGRNRTGDVHRREGTQRPRQALPRRG